MIKIIATAALLLTSAPLLAEGPKTVRISAADLNLASAQGRAQLDERLDRAAEQVCAARSATDLRMLLAVRACLADAKAGAVTQRDAILATAQPAAAARIASAR